MKKFKNNTLTEIIRPFRFLLSALLLVTFFVSMCNFFLVPYSFKRLLDSLAKQGAVEQHGGWTFGFFYLLFCLLLVAIFRAQNIIWIYLSPKIRKRTYRLCMSYLLFGQDEVKNFSSSSKKASAIKDLVSTLPNMIQSLFEGFFSGVLAIVIASCMAWSVRSEFGIGLVIWIIFYVIGSISIIKRAKNYAKKTLNINSGALAKTNEVLGNRENVKLFNREKYEELQLKKIFEELYAVDKEKEKFKLKVFGFQGLSFFIYQTISVLLLFHGCKQGFVGLGDVAMILTINFSFVDYFRKVSKEIVEFADHWGTVTEAINHLSMDSLTKEDFPFKKQVAEHVLQPKAHLTGHICVKNLSFQHTEHAHIFKQINLDISPGQRVLIIGESGIGKSTFVDLLTGLKKPSEGSIYFDGHDASSLSPQQLRKSLGVVHQKLGIFSGTILENILYGNPKAKMEDVKRAAKLAHIHSFIESLPKGYYTYINIHHSSLSKGQCQRIALARVLVRDAKIFLFDEVSSHLDQKTMAQVEKNLIDHTEGKTAIFITHHSQSELVSAANRILRIKDMEIQEVYERL